MGTVSDACGRRKRGYAAAPDASTHTVSLDLSHSQAAWRGLNPTPRWQVPPCVVASLTPPAKQQRAVREALNPAINATGWRQCGGPTGVSQLNNPQHNPQRRAFSLNSLHRCRPHTGRSDRRQLLPAMADILAEPPVRCPDAWRRLVRRRGACTWPCSEWQWITTAPAPYAARGNHPHRPTTTWRARLCEVDARRGFPRAASPGFLLGLPGCAWCRAT